jgi:hypothetical protein
MTTPFCITMPGFESKEIDSWQEGKDFKELNGINVSIRQREYILNPDGMHAREPVLVSLDAEDVVLR